jgi:hypothetical protein
MSEQQICYREPRKLTKLELIDIHLLVKATRPVLLPAPKVSRADASKS